MYNKAIKYKIRFTKLLFKWKLKNSLRMNFFAMRKWKSAFKSGSNLGVRNHMFFHWI